MTNYEVKTLLPTLKTTLERIPRRIWVKGQRKDLGPLADSKHKQVKLHNFDVVLSKLLAYSYSEGKHILLLAMMEHIGSPKLLTYRNPNL